MKEEWREVEKEGKCCEGKLWGRGEGKLRGSGEGVEGEWKGGDSLKFICRKKL